MVTKGAGEDLTILYTTSLLCNQSRMQFNTGFYDAVVWIYYSLLSPHRAERETELHYNFFHPFSSFSYKHVQCRWQRGLMRNAMQHAKNDEERSGDRASGGETKRVQRLFNHLSIK